MEKLTRKQFVEALAKNTTSMVLLINRALHEHEQKFVSKLTWQNAEIEFGLTLVPRTVVKVRSASLQFSNDSYLYFDQRYIRKDYYRIGDLVLMQSSETNGGKVVKTLGYLIKSKNGSN